MSKVERFEDIRAWQAARALTNLVYDITLEGRFSQDFDLKDQMRAAAGSIMHNIAEGFGCGSDAEFSRFLRIARRSASEVQSQLYLALDRKYIDQSQFQIVYDKATEIKKLINAFIAYLRPKNPSSKRLND